MAKKRKSKGLSVMPTPDEIDWQTDNLARDTILQNPKIQRAQKRIQRQMKAALVKIRRGAEI